MESQDSLDAAIRSNAAKSALLIVGMPLVLPTTVFVILAIGLPLLGERNAMAEAGAGFGVTLVVVAIATVIWLPIGYLASQWIIDRATGARLLGRTEEPQLWELLEGLCTACGMRLPALRIIETDVLNAYASGLREGQYSVTVTRGLLDTLDPDELETVLAHELTHIRHHDVRLLVIATVLVGLVPILHDWAMKIFWAFVMTFLTIYRAVFTALPVPMAKALVEISYTALFWAGKAFAFVVGMVGHFWSLVIHFALSRQREFMADAGAVAMTRKPEALISALRKVSCNSGLETSVSGVRAMMFDSSAMLGVGNLFATHPPVEQRVEAIITVARGLGLRLDDVVENGPAPPQLDAAPIRRPEPVSLPRASDDSPRIASSFDYDQRREPRVEPRLDGPSLRPPNPEKIAQFYDVLLRAMGGDASRLSAADREQVYRRAKAALLRQLAADPPFAEPDLRAAQRELAQAIEALEAEAEVAGQDRDGQ